ncbi:MAG: Rpn family recombination-promoting nuclease/putative transposase [Acidobacteria bacterium]|nr:Rpn family recombination-promoting nuclease/putative transposase [Acidobacteriota bacterium]
MPKPYDQIFKNLAEDDPVGLLRMIGHLPLNAPAEVRPLPREIILPGLQVDTVYDVRVGEEHWWEHLEAQARYKSNVPERICWYVVALSLRERVPIRTTLILLAERHAPKHVPAAHTLRIHRLKISYEYDVVRLWELDPKPVLQAGHPNLLPWVMLMDASDAELEQAMIQIKGAGDGKLAAQFITLGGLRYPKRDHVVWMLERLRGMLINEEIIKESIFYQMILEEGVEKGLREGILKGRQEGRFREVRHFIRRYAAIRFPALGDLPQLDDQSDLERLEALFDRVVLAESEDAAREAIRNA